MIEKDIFFDSLFGAGANKNVLKGISGIVTESHISNGALEGEI